MSRERDPGGAQGFGLSSRIERRSAVNLQPDRRLMADDDYLNSRGAVGARCLGRCRPAGSGRRRRAVRGPGLPART
jgi:hypothetical protein